MNATQDNTLLVEQQDDVLTLTLNRAQSANALNPGLVEALLGEVTRAREVSLCVIRAAGRHFCAGFDLSEIETLSDGDLLWRLLRIELLLQAVHHAPFATLALARGRAVGAGADLFAACWQRIAAPDLKLAMPGWNFELALGTRRLHALIGADAARDLLIDSRVVSARECLGIGLASACVEPAEWPATIAELAARARVLPARALAQMLDLTALDNRDRDIAAVVRSAGRPGLKQRILAYRERVAAARESAAR